MFDDEKNYSNNTLTSLNGVRVGHATHPEAMTGCTCIVFDKPLHVVCKSYGGAPGLFNTEAMRTGRTAYPSNGLFVAGGSESGLMSAASIIQAMIEDGFGNQTGKVINPNIGGAVVYDLGMYIGQYDPMFGRESYRNANTSPVVNGNVGAGTGTTAGKYQWLDSGCKRGAMKTGVGNARIDIGNGIIVCAMSVVNPVGNIINYDGNILAGNRGENKPFRPYEDLTDFVTANHSNTTISIVGINVDLPSREHYERIAHFGAQGQIRAINPVNLSSDGDSIFVFSTGELKDPLNENAKYFYETKDGVHTLVDIVGNAVAKCVQKSIYDACYSTETIHWEHGYNGVIPACRDYPAPK